MATHEEYEAWLKAATEEFRAKYPAWEEFELECIAESGTHVWFKNYFYAVSVELTPWTLDGYLS